VARRWHASVNSRLTSPDRSGELPGQSGNPTVGRNTAERIAGRPAAGDRAANPGACGLAPARLRASGRQSILDLQVFSAWSPCFVSCMSAKIFLDSPSEMLYIGEIVWELLRPPAPAARVFRIAAPPRDVKRYCFSSPAVCDDHARDRRETPYALALCRAPPQSGAGARYRAHPNRA
jgi:hypothetical protein